MRDLCQEDFTTVTNRLREAHLILSQTFGRLATGFVDFVRARGTFKISYDLEKFNFKSFSF